MARFFNAFVFFSVYEAEEEALYQGADAVPEPEAADGEAGGGGSSRLKQRRLKVPAKAKGVVCFSAFFPSQFILLSCIRMQRAVSFLYSIYIIFFILKKYT